MAEEFDAAAEERRAIRRQAVHSDGRLILDADVMRIGVKVRLINVNATGVGLECDRTVDVGESVTVELENVVQRFHRTVRGRVRHCTEISDEKYVVGIELQLRLSPMDVSQLKMGLSRGDASGEKRWM